MHRDRAHTIVALLTVVALVGGCGSAASSSPSAGPTPAGTPAASATAALPTPSAAIATPPAEPSPPTPAPPPPDPLAGTAVVGTVVVTVSDNLVVRSEPWVGVDADFGDSEMYEPWLPLGTELLVLDGPAVGSGYTWYEVAPVSFAGLSGPGHGWVAAAGRDGEPWIGLPTTTAAEPPGVELVKSGVARAAANPKDAQTAAASITAFGLDLYRALLADPGLDLTGKNVVFSPTSIALALAMARAGAKGETAAEIDEVLHASGWDSLGAGLNALDQALASRNAVWLAGVGGTGQQTLRIANAAFGQRGWTIVQDYLDVVAAAFGAGLRLVDYQADPEAARQAINAWVNDQTAGRIPEILGPTDVNPLTRLYLVNAIYLKAEWEERFEQAKQAAFTRLDGSRVKVPTMRTVGRTGMNEREIPYAKGTGWQAVELRYRGEGWLPGGEAAARAPLAMTLILPADLAAFEGSLTSRTLERITAALDTQRERLGQRDCEGNEGCTCFYPYDLELFMPRFGIETKADLVPILGSLGIDRAFRLGAADFSGIHVPGSESDRLYISKVVHQANIDVDEIGTTAAAATAVGMATGGGCSFEPRKTITLRLDRPFLFVLRDVETGAVLFMGRVVDPSVER